MTTKLYIIATIPDELTHDWMQHLRDFDDANIGCKFELLADAPEISFQEMLEVLRTEPAIPVREIWDRKKVKQ